jgi:hypothetical protein
MDTDQHGEETRRPRISVLIANGETAAYVRDQIGHSSIKVTFDTHDHLFPGRGKEASDRYEKAMRDARKSRKRMLAIDGEERGGRDATNENLGCGGWI